MIAMIYAWWTRLFGTACPHCGGYDIVGTGYYSELCRSCGTTWDPSPDDR